MAQIQKRKRLPVDSVAPNKRIKRTKSTKNFTYQSFTDRIAGIKIDPVRRNHGDVISDETDISQSHFRSRFDHWTELNLTDNFVQFTRAVAPLSDSLAQILHHADEIFRLLLLHIEQGSAISLQPLLDLMSQFAHDLGSRFEQYLLAALQSISKLAASNPDGEAIEWSFNCLAWLFKYLSKLLVPDLRRLYDALAPLLGKHRQKSFVSRFAAEALSYLLRRASISYALHPEWLQTIIKHIVQDVRDSAEIMSLEQFQLGLVTFFTESIKGTNGTLHSSGTAVFQELLDACLPSCIEDVSSDLAVQVLEGVLSTLLPLTTPTALKRLLLSVIDRESTSSNDDKYGRRRILLHLILQIVIYRNGASISDWRPIYRFLESRLDEADSAASAVGPLLVASVAVCHNLCPVDVAARNASIINIMSSPKWHRHFLCFCDLYSRYKNDRFRNFVSSHFQKFVNKEWREHEQGLVDFIPRLCARTGRTCSISLPKAWQSSLLKALSSGNKRLCPSESDVYRIDAILEMVVAASKTQLASEYVSKLWKIMSKLVQEELEVPFNVRLFVFGRLLSTTLSTSASVVDIGQTWSLAATQSSRLALYPSFWQPVVELVKAASKTGILLQDKDIKDAIFVALQSNCHELRENALSVLAALYTKSTQKQSTSLVVANTIEAMPLSIETFRLADMHIRKVGALYASESTNLWIQLAIPSYCFGLLRSNYAPIWQAAISAIKDLCQVREGQEVIEKLAIEWLERPVTEVRDEKPPTAAFDTSTPTNVQLLIDSVDQVAINSQPTVAKMEQHFSVGHAKFQDGTARDRSQVLRMLQSVPHIAEKRARSLVPVLLKWVHAYTNADEESEQQITDGQSTQSSWSRADLKLLLAIFAGFKSPLTIYKAIEVHETMLMLLCHGDVQIQRLALQAILARKDVIINQYQESLLNLLDDDKLKDQFTTFLAIGAGDDSLREEHRAEVMPIVLRILFGRCIARSKGDQQRAIKRAVFTMISRYGDEANVFLDIALGDLNSVKLLNDKGIEQQQGAEIAISRKKQVGLLSMLNDFLGFLGSTTSAYASRLIDPVLFCLLRTSLMESSVVADDDEQSETISYTRNDRSVRTSAMRCLNKLFEICLRHDWRPHVQLIWTRLLADRVEHLSREATEAVSQLLRMFAIWASTPQYVAFLTYHDSKLLVALADCVGSTVVKEPVKQFVVADILLSLLSNIESAEVTETMYASILSKSTNMLRNLERALASDCGKELLDKSISVILELSRLSEAPSGEMITTCCSLVRQPAQKVSLASKQKLLRIIADAMQADAIPAAQASDVFDLLCSSFSRVTSAEARAILVEITLALAGNDKEIQQAAELIQDLHSVSTSRLDEPDFARREHAFAQMSSTSATFNAREWALFLSNAMFFVTDVDELSIRASAAQLVRRFVHVVAEKDPEQRDYAESLNGIVYSNIERGIRDKPEEVRAEYLSILAEIVKILPTWQRTSDLVHLVWNNDDETSFFNNILHIQQHRRLRAMSRLQDEVQEGTLSSRNIAHLLIPLLEQFIFAEDKAGETAAEAARTIGKLAEWVDFPQFRSLFKRYLSYIQSKPDLQETVLKLLDHVAAAFGNAHGADVTSQAKSKLSKTLPKVESLSTAVTQDFMPPLARFLQEKDESFVSRRVAAVVVAARILQVLPPQQFAQRFPPILTNTCNIMRSRDQNSRDMTRKALASICKIIGPGAFSFVIKELRRALQKGFFLHVLGYTVHALLEATMEEFKPGDLDHCTSDIMEVIMDDIFGVTGQEKEAAEFLRDSQSKKEVKSRKSFDTMQLLASVTSTQHLIELVRPIKELLLERLPAKMLPHVDELLRRVDVGIAQSKCITNADILTFCFQLNQDAFTDPYVQREDARKPRGIDAPMPDRWKERKTASLLSQQEKLGKIVSFSLDLFRTVLRKHSELKTPSNISGFLPTMKNTMMMDNQDIKLSAIRLYTAVVAVPLRQLEIDAPSYIEESVKLVDVSASSKDELTQAALKLVATVLRERKAVKISNATIVRLLKKIKPDLQVISQQGIAFNFIRSVMSRKIIVPEIYDLMDGDDGIAAISVRDHDRTTRDLARGVYMQFVMDYPQAQKRFDTQLKFLIRNLEYQHPEGRMSVMEALNTLSHKLGDKLVQEVVKQTFWPVVAAMTNDDSADCRLMAQGLLKAILGRANESWLETFLSTIQKLLKSPSLLSQQTALQCWTYYLTAKGADAKAVDAILGSLHQILAQTYDDPSESWQIRFYALNTFQEVCNMLPAPALSRDSTRLWKVVYAQLSFPHSWVKHEAAKLVASTASDLIANGTSLASMPLVTSYGMQVDKTDLMDLTRRQTLALREGITESFASQLVRNLLFIGRCFGENGMTWSAKQKPLAETSDFNGDEELDNSDDDVALEPTGGDETVDNSALAFLIRKAAAILRQESQKRLNDDSMSSRRAISLIPRTSALQLLAALVTILTVEQIRPSITTIMWPLVHLTDVNTTIPKSADTEFTQVYNAMVTNATELLDILQNKLGTTVFVDRLTQVKRAIGEKRHERRVKRRVEVISNPQLVDKRRAQKRDKDQVRRKEKSEMHRGRRRGW